MKTAMQLMLEDLELRYKVLSDAQMLQACAAIEGTIEYSKSLIIKEKEQIKDAWDAGMSEGIGTMMADLDWDGEFVNYYKETYGE